MPRKSKFEDPVCMSLTIERIQRKRIERFAARQPFTPAPAEVVRKAIKEFLDRHDGDPTYPGIEGELIDAAERHNAGLPKD